jgi:hypothetical protein
LYQGRFVPFPDQHSSQLALVVIGDAQLSDICSFSPFPSRMPLNPPLCFGCEGTRADTSSIATSDAATRLYCRVEMLAGMQPRIVPQFNQAFAVAGRVPDELLSKRGVWMRVGNEGQWS